MTRNTLTTSKKYRHCALTIIPNALHSHAGICNSGSHSLIFHRRFCFLMNPVLHRMVSWTCTTCTYGRMKTQAVRPCTSTTFHRKRLGWYYRWHVDWPLPSTWTPRRKYLLHFLERVLPNLMSDVPAAIRKTSGFSMMENLPTLAMLFENTSIGLILIARSVEAD